MLRIASVKGKADSKAGALPAGGSAQAQAIRDKSTPVAKPLPTSGPDASPMDAGGLPADLPTDPTNAMPTDPTSPDGGKDGKDEMQEKGGGLDPVTAGYRGPEQGPFMCGNCQYFASHGPNTCEFVSGDIDEMGVCNIFTASPGHDGQDTGEQPTEQPVEGNVPPVGEPVPTEPPIPGPA